MHIREIGGVEVAIYPDGETVVDIGGEIMSPLARRAAGLLVGPLFTSTQAGASPDLRARLSAQVLDVLRTKFNIHVVGHLDGQPLVRLDAFPHYYTPWCLCDNGGELNVGPVNRDEEMRSVPYTAWSTLLDAGTIAYRVSAVLRDEVIDYDLRRPELVRE